MQPYWFHNWNMGLRTSSINCLLSTDDNAHNLDYGADFAPILCLEHMWLKEFDDLRWMSGSVHIEILEPTVESLVQYHSMQMYLFNYWWSMNFSVGLLVRHCSLRERLFWLEEHCATVRDKIKKCAIWILRSYRKEYSIHSVGRAGCRSTCNIRKAEKNGKNTFTSPFNATLSMDQSQYLDRKSVV